MASGESSGTGSTSRPSLPPATSRGSGLERREEQVPPGGWHQPIPTMVAAGERAGWWRRAAASAIDVLVICVPALVLAVGVLALILGPLGGITFDDEGTGILIGVLVALAALATVAAVVFVTALLYASLTMRRPRARNGQTWGKQALGVRVVRASGDPVTFVSAALREVVVKLLLFGAGGSLLGWVPTILDVLWPVWDGQDRALHDMLADTRVIRA